MPADTDAGAPVRLRVALATAVAFGGCASATVLLRRHGDAAASLVHDKTSPVVGPLLVPLVGVVLALTLLTLMTTPAGTTLRYLLRRASLVGSMPWQAVPQARSKPSTSLVGSDTLATLSHEVRTPLNALIGMAELLMTTPLDAVQRNQVGHLRRSAMLILGLIDDVLDRASVDGGHLLTESQPFELSDVLADVVELLQIDADTKGIRLQTEVGPGCPAWVRGDAPRLRQVLVNLLSNAVKFSDGGVVTLEVCRAARPEPSAALYFQVTDTGNGIPDDQLSRIFEPYVRVLQTDHPRQRGAGLGLHISQALVRGMGGEIVVTSREGVGSAFGFELVLPPEPVPASVAASLADRRIVLLDRQPLRAARTADQLRAWGADVEVVVLQHWLTGPADLVVVREDHPDVLADLGARLRRSSPDRPPLLVITTSAHAVPNDALTPDDLVTHAATAGKRLRAALAPLARRRPDFAGSSTTGVEERPLRVLLAEDDPTSRHVCRALIRRLGHDIDVVADGAAAVRAAASTTYDLILMDSQMPELDGIEATCAIRAGDVSGSPVRIIALTGAVRATDQEAYARAGMDGLLAKPVDRARLAYALADVQRRRGAPHEQLSAAGCEPGSALPLAG